MPQIVTQQGLIQAGDDLDFNNYQDYLERALRLNGWTANLVQQGNSGYLAYDLNNGPANFRVHTYLKPVKWRRGRNEGEKQHQMSANVDMRGFQAIQTENEFTTIFGIYRDPTGGNDDFLVCAWHPDEWGPRKGETPYNHNLRVSVLRDAFLYGYATQVSDGRRIFAFKPEFIHYYLSNRLQLHGGEQIVPIEVAEIDEEKAYETPLNQILYGPPGTGKTYATISKAVEIINGYDTTTMPWDDLKESYDDLVDSGKVRFVTFHQSYSYEEFIEGIKPVVEGGNVRYEIVDGVFKKLCIDAAHSHIRVGDVFQNRNGNNFTIVQSNRSITNIQRENGALVSFPTSLVLNLVQLVKDDTLSPQNISDREKDGRNIEEFLDLHYDRYIFGYDSILRPLVEHIIDNEQANSHKFVLIIDEINRGNISRIFGELITLIEDSKRLGRKEALTAKLTYSGQDESIEPFGVPSNVYIIGTMNSADRSIALIDTALRRRFTFYNYPSDASLISSNVEGIDIRKMFEFMNKRIEFLLDRDHLLGHGYFMHVGSKEMLGMVFRNKIIPLLEEYFYGDFEKIQYVLGDNPEFGKAIDFRMIKISSSDAQRNLFGTDIDGFEDKSIYGLRSDLQEERFKDVPSDVYKSIYEKIAPVQPAQNDGDQNDEGDN